MLRDDYNIVPVLFAGLLHAAILAAMIFAFDFSRPAHPAVPLAIKGTLLTEDEIRRPPRAKDQQKPAPDTSEKDRIEAEARKREEDARKEQQRIEAEARKREEDARKEKERISRIKKQQQEEAAEKKRREVAELEKQRQEAAEKKRRDEAELEKERQEAAEKKRRDEAELEKRRQDAEKKRLEDVEKQRVENERKRREAEEAERQRLRDREIAEEEQHLAAMNAGELDRYLYAIRQKIQRNWVRPPSARPGLECVVNVRQLPGGEVVGASIGQCNGDEAVKRSIEAAVFKASPLPEPENPTLFDRNLRITFKPEQ